MFAISEKVMAGFSGSARNNFDQRAYAFVVEHFPDVLAVRGQDGIRRLIVAGQNRAELSGCRTEQEIMTFMLLQLLLGERFDIEPGLQHAIAPLYAPEIEASVKLDEVIGRLGGAAPAHVNG